MTTANTENRLPSYILLCDDDRWGDSMYAFRDWDELRSTFMEMWSDMTEEELDWLENDALPSESGIYPCYQVSESSDGTAGHYANNYNSHEYYVAAFEDGSNIADAQEWDDDYEEEEDEDA